MVYGSYINSIPTIKEIKYKHNGDTETITRSDQVNYLGLTIDSHLRWDKHIIKIVKKLKFVPFILSKLKNIMTSKIVTSTMYNALFLSTLRYGLIVWGGARKESLTTLQVLQNIALKKIYNKHRLYSTEKLYLETKQLNIRQLFSSLSILKLADEGIHDKEYEKQKLTTKKLNFNNRNNINNITTRSAINNGTSRSVVIQGGHNVWNPGKSGKVRELRNVWKSQGKSGNFQ